jgi:hypothetical protein
MPWLKLVQHEWLSKQEMDKKGVADKQAHERLRH